MLLAGASALATTVAVAEAGAMTFDFTGSDYVEGTLGGWLNRTPHALAANFGVQVANLGTSSLR